MNSAGFISTLHVDAARVHARLSIRFAIRSRRLVPEGPDRDVAIGDPEYLNEEVGCISMKGATQEARVATAHCHVSLCMSLVKRFFLSLNECKCFAHALTLPCY